MRRLSPPQQEALRKREMAAIRDGISAAEAVRVFGDARGSIANWKRRFAAGGVTGLISGRPRRRTGEQTKLSPSEVETLVGSIVDYAPDDLKLDGKLWTRHKMVVLADQLFGIASTDRYFTGTRLRRVEHPNRATIEYKFTQKIPTGRPGAPFRA
ncbi:hypothetical protein GCM10029992_32550 [Glycomyces albus]